jgi:hypothetical protein
MSGNENNPARRQSLTTKYAKLIKKRAKRTNSAQATLHENNEQNPVTRNQKPLASAQDVDEAIREHESRYGEMYGAFRSSDNTRDLFTCCKALE